jgi:hypothetical protein
MVIHRNLRRRSCFLFIPLVAGSLGCQKPERAPARNEVPAFASRDSLAVTTENGMEIWYTLTRVGRAADGSSCIERGLEIRRDSTRIPVPLLYTGSAPVLLDESRMRAELWNHCRPVDTYLVDLRTGRPVRERPGSTR